jgi:hypothetical protein
MSLTGLVIGILGVWRVSHLLHAENGPWNVIERLRRLTGAGLWGGLLGCFYCLSLWVAGPFALLLSGEPKQRLLLWPALSAGAILIERLSSREVAPLPAAYLEDEEKPDVRMYEESGVAYAGNGAAAPSDTGNMGGRQ